MQIGLNHKYQNINWIASALNLILLMELKTANITSNIQNLIDLYNKAVRRIRIKTMYCITALAKQLHSNELPAPVNILHPSPTYRNNYASVRNQ